MDVKEAVAAAKRHVNDLFADERIEHLRLEEFVFDDHLGVWSITIGFARGAFPSGASSAERERDYKVVRIAQSDKAVLSVNDR